MSDEETKTDKPAVLINPTKAEVWARKFWNDAHTKKTYLPMVGVEQVHEGVKTKSEALAIAQKVWEQKVAEYHEKLLALMGGEAPQEAHPVTETMDDAMLKEYAHGLGVEFDDKGNPV